MGNNEDIINIWWDCHITTRRETNRNGGIDQPVGNESKPNMPKLGVRTCCSGTTSCGAVKRPQDKCCRSSTKKKDETRKNMMTHGKIMLTAADQLKSEVGLTPYNSPGALCLLAGTDLTDGVWYPMGGRVWRGWKGSLRQKGAGNSGEEGIRERKNS